MTKALRIGLVLCSSTKAPLPSTRIAVLNMVPRLQAAGFEIVPLFEPEVTTAEPDLTGVVQRAVRGQCDVVILQKVQGPSASSTARQLAAHGISTVYVVCDLIDANMVEATTVTVAVTDYLKSLYPARLRNRIHVVHDGIERPTERKTEWNLKAGSRLNPLTAVLVTSVQLDRLPIVKTPPAWLKVRIVGKYAKGLRKLREASWAFQSASGRRAEYLQFLLSPRIQCIPWSLDNAYQQMQSADIGIIPIEKSRNSADSGIVPSWEVKSENRLTMKMAMGLPVVATPIPSYVGLIQQGINGFLAESPSDWDRFLESLRDPALRRSMGAAARSSVIQRYSQDEQAAKLINVLQKLVRKDQLR